MTSKKLYTGLTKMRSKLHYTKYKERISLTHVILLIIIIILIVTDVEDLLYLNSKLESKIVKDNEANMKTNKETESFGIEFTKSNNEKAIKVELNKEIQAEEITSNRNEIVIENEEENLFETVSEAETTTTTLNRNDTFILSNTNDTNIVKEVKSDDSNDTSSNLNKVIDENKLTNETLTFLRKAIKCLKKNYDSRKFKRGDYWIFENFVKANHGDLECYGHVTLSTHSEYTYLDNLEFVVQRWLGPISVSVFAPGADFSSSINTIQYLRECSPQKDLIRHWVTFHLYFLSSHIPQAVSETSGTYNCSLHPPYANKTIQTYKKINNLTYPINIGRNLARDAALTHYVLSVDIELYPSPSLGYKFLNMLARNTSLVDDKKRRVFLVKPFEIEKGHEIPRNKTELLHMLINGTLIPFHTLVCKLCHNTPLSKEWVDQGETEFMDITGKGSRTGEFSRLEPVFICTKDDPRFEDRLTWEGMRDKMTQAYLLCVQNYEILVLSNAFLVHNPGIHRTATKISDQRWKVVEKQSRYIDNDLRKEFDIIYGTRDGCIL